MVNKLSIWWYLLLGIVIGISRSLFGWSFPFMMLIDVIGFAALFYYDVMIYSKRK